MFNFTKKKTIIGIAGLILSIMMAVVLGGFDGEGGIEQLTAEQTVIRFFCVSGIALALGFLMLILFDWKMFLVGFGSVEVMIAVQFITAVNVSTGFIIFPLLIAGVLLFFFTAEYRNCKYRINGATSARQQRNEQRQIEELEKLTAEDEELKRSIGYPEKSIILTSQMGSVFQVINRECEYYFHYVGTILARINWSNLITDFDYTERYANKKDFVLNKQEITDLKAALREIPQFMDFGTLKIKLNGKKAKSFGFINAMTEEELKTFFGDNLSVNKKGRTEKIDDAEPDDKGRQILNRLNLTRYIFSVIASVFFVVYTFFNSEKTDFAFTVLAGLICLAPFVFYLVFQDYLSIRDVGKYSKIESGKLEFVFNIILFPMIFALKCLLTSQSVANYQLWKLALYSLIPLAVLSVVFFLFCKEYKKFKSCILVFLMAMLAFCPSFIYKANFAIDLKQPEEIACKVVEMPTHTDNNGNVTYYFVFEYGDKTIKTEVDEFTYAGMVVGGEVTVQRYNGAFGINTVYLK